MCRSSTTAAASPREDLASGIGLASGSASGACQHGRCDASGHVCGSLCVSVRVQFLPRVACSNLMARCGKRSLDRRCTPQDAC